MCRCFALKWEPDVSAFFIGLTKEDDIMSQELVRIIDNISRDKNIDPESIFLDLEAAMVSAARKYFGSQEEEDIVVSIDRQSGEITAFKDEIQIDIR